MSQQRQLLPYLIVVLLFAVGGAQAQVMYSNKADPNALSNVPANSIGADNGWYFDVLTSNIYGPKLSGKWPATPASTLLSTTSTSSTTGTGSDRNINTMTCAVTGSFSATGNPACLTVTTNVAAGTTGFPTAGKFLLNLNSTTSNLRGAYGVPFETLVSGNATEAGWSTTLTAPAIGTATALSVASIAGIVNGDFIVIALTNGRYFSTVVTGASALTLNISPALPSGASNGGAIYGYKGVLQGAILQSQLTAPATKFYAAVGGSSAVYTAASVSPLIRASHSFENDAPSASAGVLVDTFIDIAAQSVGTGVTAPVRNVIDINDLGGGIPLDAAGAIITAHGFFTNWGVASAIDLTNVLLTSYFATWTDATATNHYIKADGSSLLASPIFKVNNVQEVLWDTSSSSTAGGLIRLAGASGSYFLQQNTAAGNDFGTARTVYTITSAGVFQPAITQLAKVAFASLPTCNAGAEGTLYSVTDSNSVTFNAAMAGGGANHVMAYCDATSWKVH